MFGSRLSQVARHGAAAAAATIRAAPVGTAWRSKHTLVLMRHGQSSWNLENRFTGWVDVPLTDKGVEEARAGGRLLKEEGLEFDVAYTSVLRRAIKTLWLSLEECDQMWVPVVRDYRLNERHYGALAGLNKAETTEKHGEEQVLLWRRSYATPPPPMDEDHEFSILDDRRYSHIPRDELPRHESLKTTVERVVPYWNETIAPAVKSGKRVIVAAHGNSLRALVKHLDNISDEDIIPVNIPTGVPLVYELDEDLKPIRAADATGPLSGRYLGDPEKLAAEIAAVAAQASAK